MFEKTNKSAAERLAFAYPESLPTLWRQQQPTNPGINPSPRAFVLTHP